MIFYPHNDVLRSPVQSKHSSSISSLDIGYRGQYLLQADKPRFSQSHNLLLPSHFQRPAERAVQRNFDSSRRIPPVRIQSKCKHIGTGRLIHEVAITAITSSASVSGVTWRAPNCRESSVDSEPRDNTSASRFESRTSQRTFQRTRMRIVAPVCMFRTSNHEK